MKRTESAEPVPSQVGTGRNHNDTEEQRTPLPKFQLFLVLLIQFAEPITAIVVYPFVNQFVQDTGITQGDDKKTGYYGGIIESVFFFAEAVTVFQWGRLSDRFGRRPVLLIAPLGLTFAMLKFGYSTSFWSMVWSRCMQGVFNGNIGVSKTVMIELTDATNIGDAFAFIPLMWNSGSTLAPIMGGTLSNPVTRWPNVFGKSDLFKEHPYLLPCLAASLVSFFTFVISFLGLKETHSSVPGTSDLGSNKAVKNGTERSEASPSPTDPLLRDSDVSDYGTTGTSTRCPSPISSEAATESCLKSGDADHVAPTLRSMLTSRSIQLLVVNYAFLAFTGMCYAVLTPLIYSTSIENGGLGMTPNQIGWTMGISGFVNAFVQMNSLGKMIRKYGGNQVYKVTYACYLGSFLTYPISSYLARRDGGIGFGTGVSIMIQLIFRFGSSMCYGALHVSIAEHVPKPLLGSINGLCQMIACLMRTLAPTFASSLFSWSIQKNILNGSLAYMIYLMVALSGIGFSMVLN